MWSEARLIISAVALFLGGVSPLLGLFPTADHYSAVWPILKISWIISGITSAYLLYRWSEKKTLFGKKNLWDRIAFLVTVVSGLNLGVTGFLGTNIGMSLVEGRSEMVFIVTGMIYVATAIYLLMRWKDSDQRIFQ